MRRAWMMGLLIAGCYPGPLSCPNDPAAPLPSVDEVCGHIEAIGCLVERDPLLEDVGLDSSCAAGHADVQRAVPAAELERILRCYRQARTCTQIEGCNQTCGPEGGPISYLPGVDLPPDAGSGP